MIAMSFLNIKMAWFFLLPLFFIACFLYSNRRRGADLDSFAGASKLTQAKSLHPLKLSMLCTASVLLTIALMEPVWQKVPKELNKEGRDLVFVLDVSNSMKARDLIPNRLEKAKISITECVNSLKDHRVGLVIFAGSASIKCPLTLDYEFFLHILSRVNANDTEQGGTRIEDAVLKTCDKLFSDNKNGNKDIILISDGGDLGKSVSKAIEAINKLGIRIITIGVGDAGKGARIPLDNGKGFMRYKGKEVWTKLENTQLQLFSKECLGGAYLAAGTKQMDLAQIYKQFTQHDTQTSTSKHTIMVDKDEYPLFLGLALALLTAMILTPPVLKRTKAVLPLLLLLMLPELHAASLPEADAAFEQGQYEEAIRVYVEVQNKHQDREIHILTSIANSFYKLKKYEEAVNSYRTVISTMTNKDKYQFEINYNLANSLVKMAETAKKDEDALLHLSQSLKIYRQVILQKPSLIKAAINFELTKIQSVKLQKKIKVKQEKMKQMKKQLEEIRGGLQELIKKQQVNLDNTLKYVKEKKQLQQLQVAEDKIIKGTQKVQTQLNDLNNQDASLKQLKIYEPSRNALVQALNSEKEASSYLKDNKVNAVDAEVQALRSLKEALEKLPEDPKQSSQNKKNGEEGEEGEESEESEEGEEEGEGGEESQSSEMSSKGPESDIQNLARPNDSIEKILEQEERLHQMRKAASKKGNIKKAEKDW